MSFYESLLSKIAKKDLRVGVIGLGYVGLPLALLFSEEKINTLGLDTDIKKIAMLSESKSYIKNITNERLILSADFFQVSADFSLIHNCDALIICVPTPLNNHREPNIEFIKEVMTTILPHIKKGQLISLESTTYPGTTEEIIWEPIKAAGYIVGEDYFISYSPEREDLGRTDFNTKNTPKVCGGITENCLSIAQKIYGLAIDKIVPVSSTKTAEMTKLLENIYRAVNIGLINEMKMIADAMDIDIHEVIKAASTKPFGFVPYQPGPGLGGHCIPIDPFYLTWKAKEYGFHTYFIELAGEINSSMPKYVVSKFLSALNNKKIAANGSRVLILGIAYKKNVDDTRESPAFEIMKLLSEKKVIFDYSDPHVSYITQGKNQYFEMKSINLSIESLSQYDAAILVTDHDDFDYDLILNHSRLIVDTRGWFSSSDKKIIKA